MNRSSCFIVGAEIAEYLQQLMYEADLEVYKKSKKKEKEAWKILGFI
jgi:hypothetical protein